MSDQNDENKQTGLEIAVIGMAGRFPGAANIDEFWENLKNGVESITFMTSQEIEESGISPELIENPLFVKSKGGVFEGKEFFDAPLFGYTPLEAEIMDPQTRKLHEGVWEALENAGYNPDIYNGLIGLYAGSSSNFHWEGLTLMSGKRDELGQFASAHLTGREFLSTLVSYKLNLKGPAFSVLTACSTSLVAIHLACQGLLNGECHIAIAGGVTVDTINKKGYMYREGMIMSKDGHCRAFDHKASGTAVSSGMAVVVLKPLEDAIADNDFIYAVVKGTAINNDGTRKGAYSAPSIEGQAEVIRTAHQVAEVNPESIGYIETHGTGTELGDPIEIEALKLAFGDVKKQNCAIGSVKTNIGHLDAAAGATGFIKTVLCLKNRLIPPSLNFERPNPKIDFENSPFYVNTTLSQWKNTHTPLRAAVSSFGIGGTNAHAVLEEYPEPLLESISDDSAQRAYHLFLFSAKTATALENTIENTYRYLEKNQTDISSKGLFPDIAYTLQVGRKALPHRKMMVCRDMEEAIEILNPSNRNTLKYASASNQKPPVVFMFTGQGSQYVNMGLDLYDKETVFRDEIDNCFEILEKITDTNLKEILYPLDATTQPPAINQTQYTQPLLFVFEYALSKLLMHWGIQPYAMIGHSIGEYIAAHLSGVFSLEDALKLVLLRGELMQQMPPGSMLSVSLPLQELQSILHDNPVVSIAAVNSPDQTVLSGPNEAVEKVARQLTEKGIESRLLHTSHAFHSSMMDPILDSFKSAFKQIQLKAPVIPYISNVSGTWITVEEAVNPSYWANHLRRPVLFAIGIEELLQLENPIFIEVGPGKSLCTFVNRHPAKSSNQPVINLVRHPKEDIPDQKYLIEKMGYLWLYGKAIDWDKFHEDESRRRIPLPTYPFEKKPYWLKLKKGMASPGSQPLEVISMSRGSNSDSDENEHHDGRASLPTRYVPPENKTQKHLAKIWQDFFGIKQVGILDDFFELGGDSLKANALAAKIHKEFDTPVSFTQIFNTPTIKELSGFIRKAKQDRFQSLETAEEKEYYPLSSPQKRIFLLQKIGKENIAYNLPVVFTLEGELDREKLTGVFRQLIHRHEGFRTSFHIIHEEPAQVIHSQVPFDIQFIEPQSEPIIQTIRDFIRPFDLSAPPLFRVGVVTESELNHILIIDMHHIITDGTSQTILSRDFISMYRDETLLPMKLQYKDFSNWQQTPKVMASLKEQEEYWINEFQGDIPQLHLPTDFPRPHFHDYKGNAVFFQLDAEKTQKLHKLAKNESTTLFVVLLSVFNVLLSRLSSQEDIVVGFPSAGRQHDDLQDIIGMFVNTLAIRSEINGNLHFNRFLHNVKDKTLNALKNQDYPFEELVERVKVERDLSRNPLFDVMFVLQNPTAPSPNSQKPTLKGLEIKPFVYEHQAVKFDINLYAGENSEKLFLNMQYSTNLFKEETIHRLIRYYETIISTILENPNIPLRDIDVLDMEEKNRLLIELNNTTSPYPIEETYYSLFEKQVIKAPDSVAVTGISFDSILKDPLSPSTVSNLTYGDMNRKTLQLKNLLTIKGVTPGSIVGIIAQPSIHLLPIIFGILRAGAAYIPIDPDYPAERISFMLNDSNASLVIVSVSPKDTPAIQQKLEGYPREILFYQDQKTESETDTYKEVPETTDIPVSPSSPAYIIYTSGTTGKPKGVIITHSNLVNYSTWFISKANLTASDKSILTSSYAFDLGYTSLFPPMITGASVHIISRDTYLMPGHLIDYIRENSITYLKITPSLLSVIVQNPAFTLENCATLRLLVCGGEPIHLESVEKAHAILPSLQIINHYGPTEATIGCIAQYIDFDHFQSYRKTPTIGTPIQNTQIHILDTYSNLVPLGVPGQLCISGTGIAPGYLNRPELSNERFYAFQGLVLKNPPLDPDKTSDKNDFMSKSLKGVQGGVVHKAPLHQHINNQTIFYKTGDLCRWVPDVAKPGQYVIQFLGRMDTQVKIRGFRVETSEIEKILLTHPLIKEAVVAHRQDKSSERFLCAYLVSETSIPVSQLREFLEKRVPNYMVPSHFIFIERIPLTYNGKVDKKALEELDAAYTAKVAEESYIAPGNDLEKTIASIWQEVLHLDKVGVHNHFFELGGNSLKLIQVNTRLNEILKRDIPVMTLFEYATIHSLANYLEKGGGEENFLETMAQRTEDMDEGKSRMKQRMNRRGGNLDD